VWLTNLLTTLVTYSLTHLHNPQPLSLCSQTQLACPFGRVWCGMEFCLWWFCPKVSSENYFLYLYSHYNSILDIHDCPWTLLNVWHQNQCGEMPWSFIIIHNFSNPLPNLKSAHSNLGCGPLHAWQVRVLFGMWEKHELSVFSHMHECIHTYNSLTCSHPKYWIRA